jgi:hypothetical protein
MLSCGSQQSIDSIRLIRDACKNFVFITKDTCVYNIPVNPDKPPQT